MHGVGYLIHLTPRHALELRTGAEITIPTHLIVREDALTLFGFRTADEERVFVELLGVSGVGPKSALGVLSELGPAELARAVQQERVAAFKPVAGVGPKTAKLICVQLRGKLDAFLAAGAGSAAAATDAASSAVPSTGGVGAAIRHADVVDALVGLGYAERAAAPAVDAALEHLDAEASTAEVLRSALRLLGPGGGA